MGIKKTIRRTLRKIFGRKPPCGRRLYFGPDDWDGYGDNSKEWQEAEDARYAREMKEYEAYLNG